MSRDSGRSVYELFFKPGEVTEIRAFGLYGKNDAWTGYAKNCVSGYFDNQTDFDKAALVLDRAGATGVYFVQNPVNPALLARAKNRLKAAEATTSDSDIVCLRYLYLDADPDRPKGISATDEEIEAAARVTEAMCEHFQAAGWPEGLKAFSGNGEHLVERLPDLPNDKEHVDLIKRALEAAGRLFSTDRVKIDPVNFNPSRIGKLYGTTARKGDNTPDRPHRKSYIDVTCCNGWRPQALTIEQLKWLADQAPRTDRKQEKAGSGRGCLNVARYLEHYRIAFRLKEHDTGMAYTLEACPFEDEHETRTTRGDAEVIQQTTGKLLFKCQHAHCTGRTWADFKQRVSGSDRLARFMEGGAASSDTHGGTTAGRAPVADALPSSTSDRTDDLANAQRFLALHRSDILWSGEWYVWTCNVWRRDETLEVNKKAEGMQKAILDQLAGETDDRRRRELLSLAVKLGSHSKIKAMLELSKSGVAVTQDVFDTGRYLLNCENGTIDLKTGQLLPHRREDYITRMVPIAYDPKAVCPKWTAFLNTIFAGSDTTIAFVQKAVGYSLTADTGEQCFFILYGTGQNGKSTFLNVITKMLSAYAVTCRMDTFIAKKGSQIPNDVARLNGSRFVSAIETERGRKLAEGLIKSMTGGDELTARFLHREYFEFEPTFKIWLGVNHKPVIKDTTLAMSRRIRLIPFTVTIPEADRVLNFHDILIQEELPGILAWGVEGCLRWQEDGLGWTKDVKEATDQYIADMDVLGEFLHEKCRIEFGEKVVFKDLYETYLKWAGENKEEPLERKIFSEVLEEKGFPSVQGHARKRECKGIGLL